MSVSYDRLWKLLKKRNMTKTGLHEMTGITTNAIANMGKNEHVSTAVLCKICKALHCDINDIMELIEE